MEKQYYVVWGTGQYSVKKSFQFICRFQQTCLNCTFFYWDLEIEIVVIYKQKGEQNAHFYICDQFLYTKE